MTNLETRAEYVRDIVDKTAGVTYSTRSIKLLCVVIY